MMFRDRQSTETGIAAGQSLQERDYWINRLAGEWVKARFYYDQPKTGDQGYQPAVVTFTCSGEPFSRLMKVVKDSDAKLHMVLLTELLILLWKYTGNHDIIVGTPIYRQKAQGEFVNTVLPLRSSLHPDMNFKELLMQIRQRVHEAVKHQNYPMDKLVYELDLPVTEGEFPLFDIALLLENIQERKYLAHAPCKMTFTFTRNEEALQGSLEYDTLHYGKTTAQRIINHLNRLLERTLSEPGTPLSDVDLFSEEEKKQLLREFNNTTAPLPITTLHEAFEEQARQTPDQIAITGIEGTKGLAPLYITYKELNQKSNRLAALLKEKGVTPDTIVAIMEEPSIQLAVAIIGTLKAGGAYLPLDPDYPEERKQYMLKDSNAGVLVTTPKLQVKVKAEVEKNLKQPLPLSVDIETDHSAAPKPTPSTLTSISTCQVSPANLAYVIYTSGSTGKPKGVLIEHRSIINYVYWRSNEYGHTTRDISMQLVSFSFDGFCTNFYPPLLSGGRVVFMGTDKWRDTEYIRNVIQKEQVSNFSVVPSMYRVMLEEAREQDFKSMRFVVLAGEKAGRELIRISQTLLPEVELINEYGPTENTITTTWNRPITPDNTTVIGRPISNHRVLILDEHGNLKPVGVPGELCVTGAGLARGYLNNPELTAGRFCLRRPGGALFEKTAPPGPPRKNFLLYHSPLTLYHTGDLARWQPDGTLEILGRKDNQVQIRGFRVEPEEIERRLLKHQEVKEAAVIVKEAKSKSAYGSAIEYNYLCAFIVTENEDLEGIKEYLAKKLPGYMVPTYMKPINAMPLTPNGKINRKRLAQMDIDTGQEKETAYEAPRDKIEQQLVHIWTHFLEKEQVGIRDNFFSIGGDSIKTIGLLNLINSQFQTAFALVDLYENETIEKFAQKIKQNKSAEEKTADTRLRQEVIKQIRELKEKILDTGKLSTDREIEDIYPMSDIETGMIYYSLRETTPTTYYNQVVYQLRHRQFDQEIFKQAFQLVVEKHEILRTGFNISDFEEPVQIVYKNISIDIAHEDITRLEKNRQEAYINTVLEKDRAQPFDIQRPESLWRVRTFTLDTGNICFIWIGHHALIDGWSSASLVTELNNLYQTLETTKKSGTANKLQKLKASYKDYIIEQLIEKRKKPGISFWEKELQDYKRLEFPGAPTNRDKPAGTKTRVIDLGASFLEDLTKVVKKNNTSLRNVCLGAYLYMLNMLSYDNDILAGIVTNNRPNCEDGEKIIGCFLNTVPIRMKIPPRTTYVDYFEQLGKKLLEMKRYEKLSLFEILRVLGEGTQERNPLFDTIFNFVDFHIYQQLQPQEQPEQENTGPGNRQDYGPRQLTIDGSGSINTLFNFDVNITRGYFYIALTYSRRIIDDRQAVNCCHFYKRMLKQYVQNPGGVLQKAALLSPEEKRELLETFNRTRTDYPQDKTLQELFRRQVLKTPDHTALLGKEAGGNDRRVEDNEGTGGLAPLPDLKYLTYNELDKKTNQLAYVLKEKGVKPDTVVGIMVERSLEMIIGLIGILKAGGAYLPIGPENPQNRIDYMLKDSNAGVLVITSKFQDKAEVEEHSGRPRPLSLQFIKIETELASVIEPHPSPSPLTSTSTLTCQVNPANLAYVIYTSGTTGRPKGVMVEHRNAVNVVSWFGEKYQLEKGVHVLQMSEYIFDPSVNQVFGTLLHGASLYLIQKKLLTDIPGLRQYIQTHHIQVINYVPALLEQLLAGKKLDSLQAVVSGAEKLEEKVKDMIIGKGYRLYNQYGPTETTIDALCAQCTPEPVTLGKPIANVCCFILDNHQDLQPIGVPGELFIAGAGVTRGYLNNPELTVQKFCLRRPGGALFEKTAPPGPPRKNFLLDMLRSSNYRSNRSYMSYTSYSSHQKPPAKKDYMQPCSHAAMPSTTHRSYHSTTPPLTTHHSHYSPIYRTGDLVRWQPDGNIEFLGRLDRQLKIMGYRVELQEIENYLHRHKQIKKAVVQPIEKENKALYLCAYIVTRQTGPVPGTPPRPEEIANYLSQFIPGYMIPSTFVFLDDHPLTPGGKIDLAALREAGTRTREALVQPRDKTERKLAGIWTEILKIETPSSIGIDDNFFEMGGHSLNATILASKIHKELKVKIPLAGLFKNKTIREQANYIENQAKTLYASIEPVEKKEYYPLSSAQKRLHFLQQMDHKSISYNIPHILSLGKEVKKSKLETTLKGLIARHESLRTSFITTAEQPVQRVHEPNEVEFEIQYYDKREFEVKVEENEGTRGLAPLPLESAAPLRSPQNAAELIDSFIRPFELTRAPLIRSGLIKCPDSRHIWIVDMHHIISDGTSHMVLTGDFMSLYAREELAPLRLQYRDFSSWQTDLFARGAIKAQENYWQELYVDAREIPRLNLPTDHKRPEVFTHAGETFNFVLEREEAEKLKTLHIQNSGTLYMNILGILNVLFYKYTGQTDIIIGSGTAGRQHADLQHIIGMFVNILGMRNNPEGEKTYQSFLKEVIANSIKAFENQDVPFEELIEKLNVARDTSRNPLFDIAMGVQNFRQLEENNIKREDTRQKKQLPISEGDENLPFVEYTNNAAKFDITFFIHEREGDIYISMVYYTAVFEPETIQRLAAHFKNVIKAVINNPGIKLKDIEIISGREKQQVLYEFNNTQTEYPQDKTIHELFAGQVEKYRDHMAVVGQSARRTAHGEEWYAITYKELNKRANQLARLLREKGVKVDTVVGIMMDRSLEMIIALIGILKAGGAYLPIETNSPEARIISMLEDCQAPVLLTNSRNIQGFSFTALQSHQSRETKIEPHITVPRAQITDFDSLPYPDYSLIDYEKYARHIGFAMVKYRVTMQATRGCPYHCAYCHKIWPKTHVVRSAENIFREVRFYYNLGIRRFVFVDDIFNLDIKNSTRFFQLIIENNMNTEVMFFFPGGLRGDILTREYIDLMIKAGTIGFALALESASLRIQKYIKKNLKLEKLKENIDYICKKYPQVILELQTMHGFPTETKEEALMTLDFIKRLKWVHFPYIHVLKIYQDCDMEKMARESGIPLQRIIQAEKLAFHELPDTLPFEKSFTMEYQTKFLNEYFLSKERLLHVLPYQIRILTEEEIVKKYNSYLPVKINNFTHLLQFLGITKKDMQGHVCISENRYKVPDINMKIRKKFPVPKPSKKAIRILLMDLSQFFTQKGDMLYDVYEPPLGLMYLLTYLNRELGSQINGKIVKSRIDFDNYTELKTLLEEFKPDVIGIRALTLYRDFFHETAAMIRHWGIDVPVITGGPYATSNYKTILQDGNIDLAVLGEGEITFKELIKKIMENQGKIPQEAVLKDIPGIAFIPGRKTMRSKSMREIFMMDEFGEVMGKKDDSNLEMINKPADMAYTIFTSGTTGRPKGVMIGHGNVVNVVSWYSRQYKIQPGTRVMQLSAYTFDASVNQVFGTLLHGAALYMVNNQLIADISALRQYIQEHHLNIINFVPVFLNELLGWEMRLESLQAVIAGGEILTGTVNDSILKKGYRLYNQYGPTETTIDALMSTCSPGKVNLGKPIANVAAYILDQNKYPLPVGAAGELYVTGAGVARGYLNNPELTAEKFCLRRPGGALFEKRPPPGPPCKNFSLDMLHCGDYRSHGSYRSYNSYSSYYHTGDLARWLPDGNIEFLGRIDHQVKIRGNRIEPAEIESRIAEIQGIKEAVVLAKEEKSGQKYLCAYIVKKTHHDSLDLAGIKRELSASLPAYMIPSYIIELEEMPLTINSKIDRSALPEPGQEARAGYTAPRNREEKKLVEIWSRVLGIEKKIIGIDDDFFDRGGQSLKATILISNLHRAFNVNVPLTQVFKTSTIRGQAKYIKESEADQYISIEPTEKKEYYDVSYAQKRLWITDRLEEEQIAYNIPGVNVLENINGEIFARVLADIIKRHEILRTTFIMIKGEPQQRVHDAGSFDFSVDYIDIREEKNREEILSRKAEEEFKKSFNLEKGPLLRAKLVQIQTRQYVLFFTMHHIIADEWSGGILVEEVLRLYDQYVNGKPNRLTPLRIQYKDYARWHNKRLARQQKKSSGSQAYWNNRFQGEIPVLELPTDYPRPELKTFRGETIDFRLSKGESAELKRIGKEVGATSFMTMLTVVNIFLYKYTGQEDIIVGTHAPGRVHQDLHDQIGFYVNMLPLRNRIKKQQSFKQLLEQVKQNTLDAYKHQEYPFMMLIDSLKIPRDMSRNPLFDVVVTAALRDQPTGTENSGISPREITEGLDRWQQGAGFSKYDIRIRFTEQKNQIHADIKYNPDLFKKRRILVIKEKFIALVKDILQKIHQTIADMTWETEFEENRDEQEFTGGF